MGKPEKKATRTMWRMGMSTDVRRKYSMLLRRSQVVRVMNGMDGWKGVGKATRNCKFVDAIVCIRLLPPTRNKASKLQALWGFGAFFSNRFWIGVVLVKVIFVFFRLGVKIFRMSKFYTKVKSSLPIDLLWNPTWVNLSKPINLV